MINSVSVRNIKKPALDRIIVSVKDERIYFTRGATLIYGLNRTLCEIPSYFRQLTYAFTSQSTRILKSFDCALSGPFGNLHLDPALSFPDSLCAHEYLYLRFNGLVVYLIKLFL